MPRSADWFPFLLHRIRRRSHACMLWCLRGVGGKHPALGRLVPAVVVGAAGIVIYALGAGSLGAFLRVASVSALIAGASWLVGCVLGFLFGVPVTKDDEREADAAGEGRADRDGRGRYGVNTNLQQISDWLTKMLVGVGLTQLNDLGEHLDALSTSLAKGLQGSASDATFALCLVLLFSVFGFLFGYLWTRLDLQREFRKGDDDLFGNERQLMRLTADQKATQLDRHAQLLAGDALDRSRSATPPKTDELEQALRQASTRARRKIYEDAYNVRSANLYRDRVTMAQSIPVFRALIAVDDDREDYASRAQLAYALKDRDGASDEHLREAEQLLTEAIEIRGNDYAPSWLYMELNRAICRIRTQGSPSRTERPQQFQAILADLKQAATYPTIAGHLREILTKQESELAGDPNRLELLKWLRANQVGAAELGLAEPRDDSTPQDG